MLHVFVSIVFCNNTIELASIQKRGQLSEDVSTLIHEIRAFAKAKSQLSIQIVTLQKRAINAMNKEFQRTLVNFYYPLMVLIH